ncbi:MAG: hypothetical protein AAB573_00700 [Patescibacteria group bacterium]
MKHEPAVKFGDLRRAAIKDNSNRRADYTNNRYNTSGFGGVLLSRGDSIELPTDGGRKVGVVLGFKLAKSREGTHPPSVVLATKDAGIKEVTLGELKGTPRFIRRSRHGKKIARQNFR